MVGISIEGEISARMMRYSYAAYYDQPARWGDESSFRRPDARPDDFGGMDCRKMSKWRRPLPTSWWLMIC